MTPNNSSDTYQARIKQNVIVINDILAEFIMAGYKEDQNANLRAILSNGARFSTLLFAQPFTWRFD